MVKLAKEIDEFGVRSRRNGGDTVSYVIRHRKDKCRGRWWASSMMDGGDACSSIAKLLFQREAETVVSFFRADRASRAVLGPCVWDPGIRVKKSQKHSSCWCFSSSSSCWLSSSCRSSSSSSSSSSCRFSSSSTMLAQVISIQISGGGRPT